MDIYSRPVLIWRWIVFLLGAGYCIDQILFGSYSGFGGPFRYLTIWALFLSFYSASRMLALTEQRITQRHEVTAICAAVLNVMVVYLYWRLFLQDPTLVNGETANVWYREYYLHGLGPMLQIIDALFVARVFRRVQRAILPLLGLIGVYVVWSELLVGPLNDSPKGTVTNGLPYPFLNSMELSERAVFYVANVGVALTLLLCFAALGWLIYRVLPSAASRAANPSR
ncbi:MAG: hypothetical protein AAFR68_00010 [Pseudomonadota bacterium]